MPVRPFHSAILLLSIYFEPCENKECLLQWLHFTLQISLKKSSQILGWRGKKKVSRFLLFDNFLALLCPTHWHFSHVQECPLSLILFNIQLNILNKEPRFKCLRLINFKQFSFSLTHAKLQWLDETARSCRIHSDIVNSKGGVGAAGCYLIT